MRWQKVGISAEGVGGRESVNYYEINIIIIYIILLFQVFSPKKIIHE